MRSFASCTFGWSKGLMCSRAPTSAVATSHSTKSAPTSAGLAELQREHRLAGRAQGVERRVLLVVAVP